MRSGKVRRKSLRKKSSGRKSSRGKKSALKMVSKKRMSTKRMSTKRMSKKKSKTRRTRRSTIKKGRKRTKKRMRGGAARPDVPTAEALAAAAADAKAQQEAAGLSAVQGWVALPDPEGSGAPYYENRETGETTWDMPPDFAEGLADRFPWGPWVEVRDQDGSGDSYWNQVTGEITRETPPGFDKGTESRDEKSEAGQGELSHDEEERYWLRSQISPGPFSQKVIQEMVNEGRIDEDTEVRIVGEAGHFRPLSEFLSKQPE